MLLANVHCHPHDVVSSSDSSKISTNTMFNILEWVRLLRNRDSTRNNYYNIWKNFNKFILQLDMIPSSWEDRVYLFLAHLVNTGKQSTTIKSYFSALKSILWDDPYELSNGDMELRAITRACHLINDKLHPRFPIKLEFLEILLFEIEHFYHDQIYLKTLFQVIFTTGYYGLLRISEVVGSIHALQARDIHVAQNKKKILLCLYSSKTHGQESKPQKVKIAGHEKISMKDKSQTIAHFCPFTLMKKYISIRGDYSTVDEPFFTLQGAMGIEQHLV